MNPLKMANPVRVTATAVGLARPLIGLASGVARTAAHVLASGLHLVRGIPDQGDRSAPDFAATAAPVLDDLTDTTEPRDVAVEPPLPDKAPVDVVGEALAAEAKNGEGRAAQGAGIAHEPRGASREEEHRGAHLHPAEADEIAAEIAAEREPPEHLTEPLLDPVAAKALTTELQNDE